MELNHCETSIQGRQRSALVQESSWWYAVVENSRFYRPQSLFVALLDAACNGIKFDVLNHWKRVEIDWEGMSWASVFSRSLARNAGLINPLRNAAACEIQSWFVSRIPQTSHQNPITCRLSDIRIHQNPSQVVQYCPKNINRTEFESMSLVISHRNSSWDLAQFPVTRCCLTSPELLRSKKNIRFL